jgi:hypothetical protein
MDGQGEGVRITFEGMERAEANRAAQALRQALIERAGDDVIASIDKDDPDSQDAGATLVLVFGSSAAVAIAQGIRTWLARRGDDRDRITIKTADGTEIVATGEAARTLDAAALVRAVNGGPRARAEDRSLPSRALILFLAANPRRTSQLALDQECAAIERELQMTAHRDDFEFRSKWMVSVDELARHLMELQPTVIHFSGHGIHTAPGPTHSSAMHRDMAASERPEVFAGGGGAYLDDDAGGPQLVTGRALAMMIRSAASSVRLVVLNACYSDSQADALRTVVDCVVGMTGAIDDAAARSFAVGFYRALGNRRSVGRAVDHAVATLAAKQRPEEQLPRCRTRDGLDANQMVLGASA